MSCWELPCHVLACVSSTRRLRRRLRRTRSRRPFAHNVGCAARDGSGLCGRARVWRDGRAARRVAAGRQRLLLTDWLPGPSICPCPFFFIYPLCFPRCFIVVVVPSRSRIALLSIPFDVLAIGAQAIARVGLNGTLPGAWIRTCVALYIHSVLSYGFLGSFSACITNCAQQSATVTFWLIFNP